MDDPIIHRYLMLLCDLHIFGAVAGATGDVPIDFQLTDVSDYVTPTAISRITQQGLQCSAFFDSAGAVVSDSDPSAEVNIGIYIGVPAAIAGSPSDVLYESGFKYIQFQVNVFGGSSFTGEATTGIENPVGNTPASLTATFFGTALSFFYAAPLSDLTGNLTIEAPATDGYLSFSGTRDVDTGAALVNHF